MKSMLVYQKIHLYLQNKYYYAIALLTQQAKTR